MRHPTPAFRRRRAAALVVLGFALVWLSGRVAPAVPASLDGLGTAGLPAAVAAARAAGGPMVASTAAALRSASTLNLIGAAALVAGFVYGCVPSLPTGVGVGLAAGGLACLLCGVLLPLLSGWVGLGVLLASALVALAHHLPRIRLRAGISALRDRLFPRKPVTT